jgi:Methyltransferase domain
MSELKHFYQSLHGCHTFADFYRSIALTAGHAWNGVEVGALYGQSAACMAVELLNRREQTDGAYRLDLVELSDNRAQLRSNLASVSHVIGMIHSPCSSVDASKMYGDNSLDMVMLDGDHELAGVRADIAHWWPKVKIGGLMATHDFAHYFPGLMRAWIEAFQVFNVTRGSMWPDEHVVDDRLPTVRADFRNRSAHGGDTDFLPVAWVRK